MVNTTQTKVYQIIDKLHRGKHIDDVTKKWLAQTFSPPRTRSQKSTNLIRSEDRSSQVVTAQLKKISSFVDTLLQPIAQKQQSYIKDTTDFISFIENTKIGQDTILVAMDVSSLYTKYHKRRE